MNEHEGNGDRSRRKGLIEMLSLDSMRPLQEKTNPNPPTGASRPPDLIPRRSKVALIVAINKLETLRLVVVV